MSQNTCKNYHADIYKNIYEKVKNKWDLFKINGWEDSIEKLSLTNLMSNITGI